MGAYLSAPVTAKESEDAKCAWLQMGASSMQGWRRSMEDAHINGTAIPDGRFFGVFDGHGGAEVSRFVARHIAHSLPEDWANRPEVSLAWLFHRMDHLLTQPQFQNEITSLKNASSSPKKKQQRRPAPSEVEDRLQAKEAFSLFQQVMVVQPQAAGRQGRRVQQPTLARELGDRRRRCSLPDHPIPAGCTAIAVVARKTPTGARELWCANAGDSRAVACRAGVARPLSFDHKPNAPIESRRIRNAGGYVEPTQNGMFRVNGNLNLSRSIGDLKYKQNKSIPASEQIITAEPDVVKYEVTADDEFFILACDGVWDVMSNQQAVDFVRARLLKNEYSKKLMKKSIGGRQQPQLFPRSRRSSASSPNVLSRIAEEMFDHCIATQNPRETRGIGGDNMTAIIVQFTPEKQPSL